MLGLLRKNTKVILWIVLISFVLWGGFSVGVQFQKKGRLAGEAFGQGVSFQEFNSFYSAAQLFQPRSGAEPPSHERLKQIAWQTLIYSREAKRMGVRVSNDEIREALHRLLASQGLVNVPADVYRRWVQSTLKMAPARFEKQIADSLRVRKLIAMVSGASIPPPSAEEIMRAFLLEHHKISAETALPDSLEAAQSLAKASAEGGAWKDPSLQKREASLVPLAEFARTWDLSTEQALKIFDLSPGSVFPEPFPYRDGFAVVRLTGKESADLNRFNEAEEKRLREEMTRRRQNRLFSEWNVDVMRRASLKDYLDE